MIQDATGKFSSRCVLPDRSSLAVVIKNWLHWSGHGKFCIPCHPRMPIGRKSHIGEYATKTNAFCDWPQTPTAVKLNQRRLLDAREAYCPWVLSTRSQALVNLGRCC